jgi:phenylpropionate dioxygenase-like ring-hydroxylating dioxygenase large terminal subunit
LSNLGIVEKEICFGEGRRAKKTRYKIKDHFFDFHYRFIHPNQSKAILITPNHLYDEFIAPKLDDYVSFLFEQTVHEFIIRKNWLSTKNTFHEIARFWGNNHQLKREIEIDVVTRDDLGIIVYECKWTTDLFRLKEVNELIETSAFLIRIESVDFPSRVSVMK